MTPRRVRIGGIFLLFPSHVLHPHPRHDERPPQVFPTRASRCRRTPTPTKPRCTGSGPRRGLTPSVYTTPPRENPQCVYGIGPRRGPNVMAPSSVAGHGRARIAPGRGVPVSGVMCYHASRSPSSWRHAAPGAFGGSVRSGMCATFGLIGCAPPRGKAPGSLGIT